MLIISATIFVRFYCIGLVSVHNSYSISNNVEPLKTLHLIVREVGDFGPEIYILEDDEGNKYFYQTDDGYLDTLNYDRLWDDVKPTKDKD